MAADTIRSMRNMSEPCWRVPEQPVRSFIRRDCRPHCFLLHRRARSEQERDLRAFIWRNRSQADGGLSRACDAVGQQRAVLFAPSPSRVDNNPHKVDCAYPPFAAGVLFTQIKAINAPAGT
jgi:hypothetical protein